VRRDLIHAAEHLAEMGAAADRAGTLLSARARAELIFARARYAFSRCEDGELTQGACTLLLCARRSDDSGFGLWRRESTRSTPSIAIIAAILPVALPQAGWLRPHSSRRTACV
jgi:hypothetical protein